MAYASGRTKDQDCIRTCVLEGDTLYVHPSRFGRMQLAAAGLYSTTRGHLPGRDPDQGAAMALLIAGLLPHEITAREHRETKIVVDYELDA